MRYLFEESARKGGRKSNKHWENGRHFSALYEILIILEIWKAFQTLISLLVWFLNSTRILFVFGQSVIFDRLIFITFNNLIKMVPFIS